MKILKHVVIGLSPALLWICPPYVMAQEHAPEAPPAAAQGTPADHTITLTKVVEVYEFEDLKVSVDQYQVNRGDNLARVLRSRGLIKTPADEARLLRLVRRLNPELEDVNKILPGQELKLPARLMEDGAGQGDPAPSDGTVTETVKIYERAQPDQRPARVVVMRHTEGTGDSPSAAGEMAAGEMAAGEMAAGEMAAGAAGGLDFPSGNHGPLAMEPETGVVYRTVKIRRGDTLERLLRREGMDNELIYQHLLKVTLKLNPEIKNRDLIFAGAELRIPAAGDYLVTLAGADPEAVRSNALARSEGRPPQDLGRAGPLKLPSRAAETAKNTLGLIFTRLGASIDTRGRLVLPLGPEGGVEFNTAEFPVIELPGDLRVVMDLESRLPAQTIAQLRQNFPNYRLFRTKPGERLEKTLDRLWALCDFYRVYKKDRAYTGGEDIRLKMAADWMIWPTRQAWNSGQPLAINLAPSAARPTDPGWKAFLSGHGIEILDLYQGAVLPNAPKATAPEIKITRLSDTGAVLAAAELIAVLGGAVKTPDEGLPLAAEGAALAESNAVLWEFEGGRAALDLAGLPDETVNALKQAGYRVIRSGRDSEAVVKSVLEGFGLGADSALTITSPTGGPALKLVIKGHCLTIGERTILITTLDMPKGLNNIAPMGLEVVRY